MNCYLVRHGEIDSNVNKVYAGSSNEILNLTGIMQAEKVGAYLSNKNIDELFSSPIKRALQTADIIGSATSNVPIVHENFKELRMGPWEGLSEDEVSLKYSAQWKIWNNSPADLIMNGRESLSDLLKRVLTALRQLNLKINGNMAIVTHVAIIRVLLLHAKGRSLNEYRKIPAPKNGGIYLWENENAFNELDIGIS